MLQYWGVSYGSVIGVTFASMHPHRVGRMLIDGIVDPDDYYRTDWLKNLQDNDKVFSKLCQYCFDARPERCPLWTGSSGTDIEKMIKHFMQNLEHNPIIVPATKDLGPQIITYADVLSDLGAQFSLHDPLHKGNEFFTTLSQLMNGSTSSFATKKQQKIVFRNLSTECVKDGDYSEACIKDIKSATAAIVCMDGRSIVNETREKAWKIAETVLRQSQWYGWFWPTIRLHCAGFTVRPAWTFEGPIESKPAHPLLIIGNTLDPVTPLKK